ncbi:MAG: hypothetical protein J0M19_12595 [Sphingomonadales bacterium]|nr:hypothetical protein [Sphingomonadales bacterium]
MSIDAIAVAGKALDGLHLRAAALAYNLANLNSPKFQSLAVDFETALRGAAAKGPSAVEAVEFGFKAGPSFGPGDERREDLMLIDISRNAGRFAALADFTGRRFAITAAAVGAR